MQSEVSDDDYDVWGCGEEQWRGVKGVRCEVRGSGLEYNVVQCVVQCGVRCCV